MSQVIFETLNLSGREVRIQAGWDNPTQCYYLTITSESTGKTLWDCMYQLEILGGRSPKGFWDQVKVGMNCAFQDLGIELPEGFWDQLEPKKGNVIIRWKKNHWLETEI